MSISASKCPFFTSAIEIVRNLKISKLQLAICQTYHISSFFAKVIFVVQVKIVTSKLISSVFVVQIKLVTSAFPTCMKFRVCILSGNCHRYVRFGFSDDLGSRYKCLQFLPFHPFLEMGCMDFPTPSAHGAKVVRISQFRPVIWSFLGTGSY